MSSLHSDAAEFAEGATTAVTNGTDGAQLIGSMAFDSEDSDGYYFIVRPTATSSGGNPFAFGVATVTSCKRSSLFFSFSNISCQVL